MYFPASYTSWSCGSVLCLLHLYYKVAILQLELRKRTSLTALVLKSLVSRAWLANLKKTL